ncbi:FGGY family carbohydrate kinase [soil metagenome]
MAAAGGGSGLLVGIDVGTTMCKAAVVDLDGVERSQGRWRTPWRHEGDETECDPGDLLDAALRAARAALDGAPPGPLVALGVTSMAESGVLLSEDGEPLLPVIAWHDPRGKDEAERIAVTLGHDATVRRTGVPPSPKHSFAKLLWMRHHRPESKRAYKFLSVAEWVVHSLGGRARAEASLASRTGWLDVAAGHWWGEALYAFGIERALLPEIERAGAPWGETGDALGRGRGAVLTVAGHDHLCAAVGAGAVADGDVLDSCGTAEAFVKATAGLPDVERCVSGGVTVGRHVLADRFALLGGLRSGLLLERCFRTLGVEGDEARTTLDDQALALGPTAPGLLADLLPIIEKGGAVPPSVIAGRFRRAALDHVVSRGADLLGVIEGAAGRTSRLIATGGGTRSRAFMALKEAALGPLLVPQVAEAGARGAALLAGCAAGIFPDPWSVPVPGMKPR